jgi:phosphoenolpyruvate---glycerone phosphotransferase subunit DhaK
MGFVVFAAIIPVAPATAAAINPARVIGPMLVLQAFGGAVHWAQLPVYVAAEVSAGVAAAVTYTVIARTKLDRSVSSVQAEDYVPESLVAESAACAARSDRKDAKMKKLINDPNTVVADALRGIEAAHPELRVDHERKIVYRADSPVTGKVGLISGGGSGHEPLHGGFVGYGMLDAACPGEVFTSPTPDQMHEATKVVDGGAGVVHIVKNYTGDVMNFDMAAEMAAEEAGVKVESIVTNDDVAVQDSLYTAGRRGVGVTVLLEKICGAAAEDGHDLASVAALGRKVNGWGRSMGMALTSCTVPAAGKPTFELAETEMEIGIGIHGEPGRYREPLGSAAEIAERLVDPIVRDLPYGRGDRVLAFVNGMGGTPLLELYVMFGEVARILDGHDIRIERSLVGSYITSLEMAGCSITLLRLDDELVRLWDAPVRTSALRWGV